MLKSESLQSKSSKRKVKIRAAQGIWALCLLAALLTLPGSASAQADFTLQAAPFSPQAVAPTGTSSSNITIGTINGFSGTVTLGCVVSSNQPTTSDPACTVSPATVTPPAGATATITTLAQTTPASYNVTITGTGPSTTHTTSQNLTVLAVTPQFTITVQSPIVPNSVPAGSGAEGVILITPINGYISPGYPKQGITLACAAITPLVTYPPVCSFSYPPGLTSLPVDGSPVTSTITITVPGPQNISGVAHPRTFYTLWLPLPMLVMVGLGAAVGGKRSRKAWGLLALFVMAGSLFLLPACSNTVPHTEALQGVTPNNTYSFTVIGVDANGVVSSNTSSSNSSNPTVTLTVTSSTL